MGGANKSNPIENSPEGIIVTTTLVMISFWRFPRQFLAAVTVIIIPLEKQAK